MDLLLLSRLHQQINPANKHDGLQRREKYSVEPHMAETEPEKWRQHNRHNQEGDEQIQRLESIEADLCIVPVFLGCQKNDGRNNAKYRHITET